MRKKVVIPDDFPPQITGSKALERLKERSDVTCFTDRADTDDEFIMRMKNADAVINVRAYSKFTETVFSELGSLKMLSVLGVGVDNIDLNAAAKHGVVVTNTPDVATNAVAEHSLALMLAAARRIPELHNKTAAGEWSKGMVMQACGKTLGLIGTGAIGSRLAVLARGIGMNVIAWTFNPSEARARTLGLRYVELEEILKVSDFISIHIKLTPEAEGLIGEKEFDMMKRSAVLVNTARGGIVDKDALIQALKTKEIAAAALDVFHEEPVSPNDPLIELENLVLTPHSAGITSEAIENSCNKVVDNVINYLQGTPMSVVTGWNEDV